MTTDGLFMLKDGDTIWGWHMCGDGSNIQTFYYDNKDSKDVQVIFRKACEYFAESEYDDCPNMNFYKEKYDPDKVDFNTEYTAYFDGKIWKKNWEDEE
jgi:hypothetical protein